MSFTLHLSPFTRKHLYHRLQQAYASGALRLVKRIHARLAWAEDMSVQEVAAMLGIGEQTVRDYRNGFLLRHLASLTYQRPPGRPGKLTKVQRRELADVIKAGPQAVGYPSGCWHTPMIQDLIQSRFGVSYPPHYIAPLLHNLGFSSQKARFAQLIDSRQTAWERSRNIIRSAEVQDPISHAALHYSICAIIISMAWTVETLNHTVDAELNALPADMRARFTRVVRLIESFGVERVGPPHVKSARTAVGNAPTGP